MSTPPHRRWYWSALRSTPALATGRPSSVKPSAPSSHQLGHLGQLLAPRPRVIARGSRRARAPRARRPRAASATAAPSRSPGRCWASRSPRRSRRRRRRACRSPDPPCAPDRGCAGARGDRRMRAAGACGPRPSTSAASPSRPASPASAISAICAVAYEHVAGRVEAARAGSSTCTSRNSKCGAPARVPCRSGANGHHASWGDAIGRLGRVGAGRRRARAGQQLVEHRHAHDDAGLDLSGDEACGESTTSPESSTPRLTGPGCISSWRGDSRRRVDLKAGGVLAQRGNPAPRSCARVACAARTPRRRRPAPRA